MTEKAYYSDTATIYYSIIIYNYTPVMWYICECYHGGFQLYYNIILVTFM